VTGTVTEDGAQAAVLASVVDLVQYWTWITSPLLFALLSASMITVTTVVRLVSLTT